MSYFDDASLVMIPSGYKDQKVYSVKPIDGSGDLTFSRASSATRVNSSGLVEKVRENVALQSNTFDTTWTATNATLTSGQSGYDGSSDAWLLDKSGTQGRLTQSITQSDLQTLSVYAKKGTSEYLRMFVNGPNSSIYFNLNDGTIQSSSAIVSGKSTNVGGGWYRFEVAFTGSTTAVNYYPAEAGSTAGTSGNIYIQDAQLETGDIATDYIATTSSAVSVGPVSGLPRLDYSGGASCPSLLLEPQRTNNALYSEQLDNAAWTKQNTTVTANAVTSPSGYQDADKLIETVSTGAHRASVSSGATLNGTFSFFAKAGERTKVAILSTTIDLGFDLSNGTLIDLGSGTSVGKIENYGNGWYRCSLPQASGIVALALAILDNAGNISYTGDGTSGAYFWGAQLEVGAYATSYIPTLSTAVTRVADEAEKTGISSLIGQTEGTIFIEAEYIDGVGDSRFSLSDGSTSNWIFVGTPEPTGGLIKMRMYINAGGVNQVNKFSSSVVAKGTHKYAVAYKANDCVMYLDGQNEGSDTSATIPACSELTLVGGGASTPQAQISTGIKQVILFPTRLTNAQLAELTA